MAILSGNKTNIMWFQYKIHDKVISFTHLLLFLRNYLTTEANRWISSSSDKYSSVLDTSKIWFQIKIALLGIVA